MNVVQDVRMLPDHFSQAQWDRLSRQQQGSSTLSAKVRLFGPTSYSFSGVAISAEVYAQVLGWMQSGLYWEEWREQEQERACEQSQPHSYQRQERIGEIYE